MVSALGFVRSATPSVANKPAPQLTRTALVVGLASLLLPLGCNTSELFRTDTPQQKGISNPMTERGAADNAQRQRDCWDMPNAHACYEVGLDYELGLSNKSDLIEAQRYYDKACELDKNEEHCKAAERLRRKKASAQ